MARPPWFNAGNIYADYAVIAVLAGTFDGQGGGTGPSPNLPASPESHGYAAAGALEFQQPVVVGFEITGLNAAGGAIIGRFAPNASRTMGPSGNAVVSLVDNGDDKGFAYPPYPSTLAQINVGFAPIGNIVDPSQNLVGGYYIEVYDLAPLNVGGVPEDPPVVEPCPPDPLWPYRGLQTSPGGGGIRHRRATAGSLAPPGRFGNS